MKNIKVLKTQRGSSTAFGLFGIGLAGWAIASWLTHVIVCITAKSWLFLIAGAIMFPVAVVHGTGVWFGAW